MPPTMLTSSTVTRLPVGTGDLGAELGGKAAGLDRMLNAGLPVPTTAVVTATAYRRFAADAAIREVVDLAQQGRISAESVDAAFLAAPLEESLAAQIVSVAGEVGSGSPIAVRSSAYAEDMAGLSFAGQYRSALDVSGADPEAVLRAVRLTWAPLWHPAPSAYRLAWGVTADDAAMSVVLMRMVRPRMAGVTFTVDPGGRDGQMRVEAVTGLAEGLVSGARTPRVTAPSAGGRERRHRWTGPPRTDEGSCAGAGRPGARRAPGAGSPLARARPDRRLGRHRPAAELRPALRGDAPPPGVLSMRRRWRERYEAAGPLPQRFVGVPRPDPPPAPTGRVMRGWAASGGRYTGLARTFDDPTTGELNSGEVLVARATDAAWTPVFLTAGAIVVERGGPLSHAAVVARELGVPAVLNVAGAASRLDGRTVTVDGDRGEVIVHDDESGGSR